MNPERSKPISELAQFVEACQNNPALREAWQEFTEACLSYVATVTEAGVFPEQRESAKALLLANFQGLVTLAVEQHIPIVSFTETLPWTVLRRLENLAS